MRQLIAAVVLAFFAAAAQADPLLFYNGRLFIDARINGIGTKALLDSAAEATLVDPKFAADAKLPQGTSQQIRGSGGTASATVVEGAAIEALGIEFHPDAIVVTDLGELSKRLIKRPTSVVLGRELFDAARLRIDIANGKIAVLPAGSSPAGLRIPLTKHAGVEAIPVTANGVPAKAEFDLGNGSRALISRALVNRLHLKVVARESGGGIGGPIMRDVVVIPRMKLAGVGFRNVRAAVDDQSNANDLNIGTSVLRAFLITTDFKHRAVFLQPAGRQ